MNSDAASFIGNIPEYYDSGLGPMIFVDYAADIARRAAALAVLRTYWRRPQVPGSSRADYAIFCLPACI